MAVLFQHELSDDRKSAPCIELTKLTRMEAIESHRRDGFGQMTLNPTVSNEFRAWVCERRAQREATTAVRRTEGGVNIVEDENGEVVDMIG